MTTLKATETLALERGRVGAGEVFRLHNKEAAGQLVAAGLAEVVDDAADAKQLDGEAGKSGGGVKVKTDKTADDRSTKPGHDTVKTKDETAQ